MNCGHLHLGWFDGLLQAQWQLIKTMCLRSLKFFYQACIFLWITYWILSKLACWAIKRKLSYVFNWALSGGKGIILHLKAISQFSVGDAGIPFSLLQSNCLSLSFFLCQQSHCLFLSVIAKWNWLCPKSFWQLRVVFENCGEIGYVV